MSASKNPAKTVRFAEKEVSAVFEIPVKTKQEALALFYHPSEFDRFRAEARWEKLASKAMAVASGNEEKLNAVALLARHQFNYTPCLSTGRPRSGAKGCARIA